MKIYFYIAIALFLSFHSFGQKRILIGLETALAYDMYEFSNNDYFEKTTLNTGLLGLNIRTNINKHFSFESGFIIKNYNEGYKFSMNGFSVSSLSGSINAWQIPLRINGKINLYKDRVALASVIGYHFCFNSSYSLKGGERSSTISDENMNELLVINSSSNLGLAKTFPLVETGIGLEIKVLKEAIFTISTSYMSGFKKVNSIDINYQIENEPSQTATAFSKGEYWRVGFGFRYPIGGMFKAL